MIVVHVAIECSEDYLTRREPHRRAHIDRLVALRGARILVGGGPAPDGQTADLFYRLTSPDQLPSIIEEDPYYLAQAWIRYASRSFSQFVEPWELPPVVLDGSRRVTVVQGPADDPDMAQLALIELRGTGRLAFGGFLDGRDTLALLRSPDPVDATTWMAETTFWAADRLTARPLLHVL
ncbi:MAG: hypothetical protein ACRELA_07025 [Candidatus Rokuibacteriota bacterium]